MKLGGVKEIVSNSCIRIFTDGACSCNPGPGGWAAIFSIGDTQKILCGGEQQTTNNRMELTAVIASLKKIQSSKRKLDFEYVISSDSAYVINAINQNWVEKWKMNDWKNSNGENVKNSDLWHVCISLINDLRLAGAKVIFCKVKGHSGNPLNEKADQIAKEEVTKMIGG